MKKIASASVVRRQPRAQQSTVELIELDQPAEARCLVTVRRGLLSGSGALSELQDASLTVAPVSLAEARRRALDFLQRRLAAGDELLRQDGFDELLAAVPPPLVPRPAAPPAATPAPVSARLAALVARFQPDRWKLLPPAHQARTAWRLAECVDAGRAAEAGQQALRALVPRLVDLLGSGKDLLDLCLAVAIARLGDAGAGEAMAELSRRGRTPATRRAAHQAWWLLLAPTEREARAAALLPDWQDLMHPEAPAEEQLAALQHRLATRGQGWTDLLPPWYDLALAQPARHAALLRLLKVLPLKAGFFQAVRHLYKAAEIRHDTAVLAVLHARFENTPANFHNHGGSGSYGFFAPDTQRWVNTPVRAEMAMAGSRLAYGSRTRDYLRRRGWRQLRRLAALEHTQAPALAVAMLLQLDDAELPPAREESRWHHVDGRYTQVRRHYAPSAGWLLVPKLLLATHPEPVQRSERAHRWWTSQPLPTGTAMPQRSEGLRAMWDAHPEALLTLALQGRSALVLSVVARALQDHADFITRLAPPQLEGLLGSRHAAIAALGFEAVRIRLQDSGQDSAAELPWLKLLARSPHAPARDFVLMRLAADPARYSLHADLAVALLLSADERLRGQGRGLALLAAAEPLLAELQNALLAADPGAPGLDDSATLIEALLGDRLAPAAEQLARTRSEPLLCLLGHPATSLVRLAVSWLLKLPDGASRVPAATLTGLLADADPARRAQGVRLLAALPDRLLRGQLGLLSELAVHPHAAIRAAVAPALQRLAMQDADLARQLAEPLHVRLFSAEPAEGVHDDILRLLTGPLAPQAPARDPASVWRALQARSAGAQRYGAWALAAREAGDFSLKQLATLTRHADVSVRRWAMQAIDDALRRLGRPSAGQAAELLPVADTLFDDARAWGQALFGERLPDESLSVELLIAWIDHPQEWLQALGRARLVRRMDAGEASLCLSRLSQHPGIQVQLFVTQWLLELPSGDPARLAQQLRALKPYFLTVLSQVHRARAAKTRVIDFLRRQVGAPETAAVVAEIFARQVVTASLTDKPQFIAGLRDIAARHPQIELPFLQWTRPAPLPR
ncbi:hypothetical protein [Eleftheria terrae]|uniref:hypothetical protein n=1 Tax=Eleftheria terrae TaxID=1597781 RepID=UPI00263BA53F|nr:hypothetical protein [Eleftheria terrae]WKB51445.1 hypothetical protein N7L95_16745 [Eleftheria terrae]